MFVAILWTSFGALVGWIVSILQEKMERRVILLYAILGAVGGLLGGYLSNQLPTASSDYDSGVTSMLFVIFGAVAVAAIFGHSTDDPEQK